MRYSEKVLASHLTNADSLDYLAREGFLQDDALEVIPTELLRRIVRWSLDKFFESRRTVAASKEAITLTFASAIEAIEGFVIEDEVETDSVQWAVADLRSHYLTMIVGLWNQNFVKEIYEKDPDDRLDVAVKYSEQLQQFLRTVRSRRDEMTGLQGVDDAIMRMEALQIEGHLTRGLTFGIPEVDEHTFGVHPGEIATIAGGPGTGKSWFAGAVTLNEMKRGRKAVLVTLENDPFMTFDRLVCMAAGIPYESWQRGDVHAGQMAMVDVFRKEMEATDKQPVVVQLNPGESTPSGIVRRAQMEGAESLIVDQMSFVQPESWYKGFKRNEQVQHIMRQFRELVKHEYPVAMVLMNQINRDGVAAARKSGRYYKEHMADGSWIEQASDLIYALYQSELMRREQVAQLQQLKARRTVPRHFELTWRPEVGDIRFRREVNLDDEAATA